MACVTVRAERAVPAESAVGHAIIRRERSAGAHSISKRISTTRAERWTVPGLRFVAGTLEHRKPGIFGIYGVHKRELTLVKRTPARGADQLDMLAERATAHF